jgi:hypothetical protein
MTTLYQLVDSFDKQVDQGLNNKPAITITLFTKILYDIRNLKKISNPVPKTKAQKKAKAKLK